MNPPGHSPTDAIDISSITPSFGSIKRYLHVHQDESVRTVPGEWQLRHTQPRQSLRGENPYCQTSITRVSSFFAQHLSQEIFHCTMFIAELTDPFLSASLVTAGGTTTASAMATILPPNSGGYITSSYPTQDNAQIFLSKFLTLSAKARKLLANRLNQCPGYYMVRPTSKGLVLTYILLPCPTTFEVGGKDIDAFVSTMSNTVDLAKVIIVPVVTLTGSCIRMVTQEYAEHLPKGIPKGAVVLAILTSGRIKTSLFLQN